MDVTNYALPLSLGLIGGIVLILGGGSILTGAADFMVNWPKIRVQKDNPLWEKVKRFMLWKSGNFYSFPTPGDLRAATLGYAPIITVLKTQKGKNGFAFAFEWDQGKEPTKFDHIKLRLFNPFGKPTQVEITKKFETQKADFTLDLDLGEAYPGFIQAKNFEKAIVQVEISSVSDGVCYQFDMKGKKFKGLLSTAIGNAGNYFPEPAKTEIAIPNYSTQLPKNMVEDVVPGKGVHLKIASNPLFQDAFAGGVPGAGGGAKGGATEATEEEFTVKKVWIAEGCIVCDACETIFPEVFHVTADTCIIRPEATPGSDLLAKGLQIQEAAEACPVEVIKYDKA